MYTHDDDCIKDECGVVGVFGSEKAAEWSYLGLFALQHRGEESAGIVVSDGELLTIHKGMGLVGDVFDESVIAGLRGTAAIGHVRYSTTGSSILKNAQPHLVNYAKGQVAIAHNGNIVNAKKLRHELEGYGSIFQSTMDSEIIVHLMARPGYDDDVAALVGAVERIRGAYSLVILTEKQLMGVRDPNGFRPLALGKLGTAWVLASETCAFDLMGATFVRDVAPGEVVIIDETGVRSVFPFEQEHIVPSPCVFEYIYFSRPDSLVYGANVAHVRERLGRMLARECPASADVVIPVPDSGNFAAIGYAQESGIPFSIGFTRNHYIGRTFINPAVAKREFKVKIKLNPIHDFISGKRVVVIDDSIVRGNTSKSRVKVLRAAGAKEVHLRISCPPHKFPCHYGIDFPQRDELIANKLSLKEIQDFLEVDSLGYVSHAGMLEAVSVTTKQFCTACFSGNYPVPCENGCSKFSLEKA